VPELGDIGGGAAAQGRRGARAREAAMARVRQQLELGGVGDAVRQ
jgi:hypothetical protein